MGELQAAKAAPSSWHSKLDPASELVKEKLGELSALGSLGLAVIVVTGALVSIVQA